ESRRVSQAVALPKRRTAPKNGTPLTSAPGARIRPNRMSKCGLQRDPSFQAATTKTIVELKPMRSSWGGSKVKPADRTLARVATHPQMYSTDLSRIFQSHLREFPTRRRHPVSL